MARRWAGGQVRMRRAAGQAGGQAGGQVGGSAGVQGCGWAGVRGYTFCCSTNLTHSAWPWSERLKQPRRSPESESAPHCSTIAPGW